MGNSAADEYQPAGDNIGTYDAAGDAGKKAAQLGVLEKQVMEQFYDIAHDNLLRMG